ncbi:hypothetical protein I547_6532 [Mycobacterium kansasii 824]|uniref:Uncharacterized protein n=1 Tax=Mycobacterium kansasii TaxID=1768 RepID=A0A1V3WIN5_MYCKA|nr:hypothetical protein I547_6532 [Mycobacterium kansasii 824]OOK66638.1 hypothetical protein BZL30_8250 [Mycobacterium kansasii]
MQGSTSPRVPLIASANFISVPYLLLAPRRPQSCDCELSEYLSG